MSATALPSSEQLWETPAVERTLSEAIAELRSFPYQKRPYAARNWGHPLHSLCSYPSKMKPGLAHFLVRLFTTPGERVLDPFAGVGTVPFEACSQGRIGLAGDLSPFAHLVSYAKTHVPSAIEARIALESFEAELADALSARPDTDWVEEEIRAFFHEDTLREIVAARTVLFAKPMTGTTALLGAAVSHLLHGNRPYALSRRSHPVIPIPPKGEFVYKSLIQSLREKISRLHLEHLPTTYKEGDAFGSDAGRLPLSDGAADAVITSPPFLGTTEFLRQNRVRLWFCGMDLANQQERKAEFVEYDKTLTSYAQTMSEWARVLRSGGRLVLHVGVVKRRDMAQELAPYIAGSGFEIVDVVYEPTTHLESHGRTDRGATHTHQILVAVRR